MRSALAVSVPRRPVPRQQSFRQSLQRDAAIREFRSTLPSPVLEAEYGRRVVCPELSQLAWNVSRATNKAAETTIKLCYGALDVGVPVDVVLQVPEKLASLIRARAPATAESRSIQELHRIETQLESDLNRLQVAMMTGSATTKDLIEARKRIAELTKVLAELDAELERQVNEATVNRSADK